MGGFLFRHRIWLFLALLAPWFFIGGPGYDNPRSVKEIWNLGHVVFFAALALAVDHRFHLCRKPAVAKIGLFLLSVLALACGIEFLQTFLSGRIASLQDVLLGLAGGVLFLLWQVSCRMAGGWKIFLRGCCAVISIVCLLPAMMASYDEFQAWRDFPVLADFESPLELSRWGDNSRLQRVRAPVASGRFAMQVALTVEQYSGFSLQYFPGDWRLARALRWSVYNPDDKLVLHYRVHDRMHRGTDQQFADRFNGQVELVPGLNTITIPMAEIENGPKHRRMDLHHIKGLGFFVMSLPSPRVLYFDRVELLRE